MCGMVTKVSALPDSLLYASQPTHTCSTQHQQAQFENCSGYLLTSAKTFLRRYHSTFPSVMQTSVCLTSNIDLFMWHALPLTPG